MAADVSDRRYDFDWLRVLGILVVFLYHSTRFFNLGNWHVKNITTYVWVEMWNVFAMTWLMPLFFIISGAGLFYSTGKSGTWPKFYSDKFLRLIIPVIVSSVTLSPLMIYLERLTHGQYSGSFISFLPECFNGLYMGIGSQGNYAYHGMHLWYLLFLFVDVIICFPLFIWLKGRGSKILERITSLFSVPGLIYIWFSIPIMIMEVVLPQSILKIGAGAWGFLYYIWFLISGFLIISGKKLQETIRKQRWISFILGIILTAVYLLNLFGPLHTLLSASYGRWVFGCVYLFSAWCWLFAIIGFGMQRLSSDRPLLQYANEGVLPFYILHQPVLLLVGYFVLLCNIHDFLKWIIIFISSFVFLIVLYIFIVRKFDLFRFLTGMKTRRSFFTFFRRKSVLIILHFVYAGLIAFSIVRAAEIRTPMHLTFDPDKDIVLNSRSITGRSLTGVKTVDDNDASTGQVIEFSSGANKQAEKHPQVYIEIRFPAPAGNYFVWIRGVSDLDDMTDSVWLQVDDQVRNGTGSFRMGNWRDIHPAGKYGWAGDAANPVMIDLKNTGEHIIRIQPRQTPHRIDQIWLSRMQSRIPDTDEPVK